MIKSEAISMLDGDSQMALSDDWHDRVHIRNLKLIGAREHGLGEVLLIPACSAG
ncbi:hypothetical protein KBY90_13305 [Cyanobium sp. CH-040]|nr:hypothetical protein [Cyanobium sp. CH-040]